MIQSTLNRALSVVDQAKSYLGSQRAVPGTDEFVVYCRKCLWYNCRPGTLLSKAVIDTPMKDGKFDGDSVPVGSSVWITVTNPGSPLHGRPIQITKRPDSLFALTGGGGIESDSRRHMILTGTPKKTKRDVELEDEIKEAEQYNEPLRAARRKLTDTARRDLREAADSMMAAVGIEAIDSSKYLQQKAEVQEYVSTLLDEEGEASGQAKKIADLVMRQAVSAEKSVRERSQRERQLKVLRAQMGERLDTKSLNREPLSVPLPDITPLAGLSTPEQEQAIGQYFEQQVGEYFDEDRLDKPYLAPPVERGPEEEEDALWDEDLLGDDEEDGPTILTLGGSVKSLEMTAPGKMQEAIDKVQDYWTKRREVEEIGRQLKKVPLAKVTPSVVEAIKAQDIGSPSLQEIEERVDRELQESMTRNTALALYDALGEHWNDDISLSDTLRSRGSRDSTMQFHVNAGASSALAALGKEVIGTRFDASRLIQDGNIEMAAAAMALEVARVHPTTSDKFSGIVEQIKQHNAVNQKATEVRTMAQHHKLSSQFQEIQQQKADAELLDQVQISNLEADNLIAQRRNLGAALGSLQASATFFDYLERLKGARRAPVLSVSVGGQEDLAESIRAKLGLKKDYDVDVSDPKDVKLNIGLSSLSKYVREAPDVSAQEERYGALKTSMEGVGEDANGNLVVDNYEVPGWNRTFQDGAGEEQEYKWRVEQRNDIEWLREATRVSDSNPGGIGGGLITRVTGAGKTNTALGYYAHKIAENPEYKAIVTVPRGRSSQWAEEAAKFSSLSVEHIPDGTSKGRVDELLADSKPGTIYIMGHREASRSHEALGLMQTDPEFADKRFHGITVDEPQELQSRGTSGNIGSLGKRLMKLKFDHRLGLTATPARRSPTEAYDLIKWTQGSSKNLGSKSSFVRTFSGFGAGTNAQDSAINKLFFDTIKPYISGDRITNPTFKVARDDVPVRRSEFQRSEQSRIERESGDFITRRQQEIMQEARDNPRSSMRTGENWESSLPRRANQRARDEVKSLHADNMNGGDYTQNGKLMAFKQAIEEGSDQKHVVFVESAAQRRALSTMFKDMGMTNAHVKNIAAGTGSITGNEMSSRVKQFRDDPRTRIIMIDPTSSSGYNLQAGDALHVIGSPDNAATYLQAQGRVARMPRTGDVAIKTYKYGDSPTEQAHWNDLDTQLKVLQAASPAMFV